MEIDSEERHETSDRDDDMPSRDHVDSSDGEDAVSENEKTGDRSDPEDDGHASNSDGERSNSDNEGNGTSAKNGGDARSSDSEEEIKEAAIKNADDDERSSDSDDGGDKMSEKNDSDDEGKDTAVKNDGGSSSEDERGSDLEENTMKNIDDEKIESSASDDEEEKAVKAVDDKRGSGSDSEDAKSAASSEKGGSDAEVTRDSSEDEAGDKEERNSVRSEHSPALPQSPEKSSGVSNKGDDSGDEESSEDESDHEEEAKVGELIADIFGESDQDEEFEGFGEEEVAAAKRKKEEKRKKTKRVLSESEDGETENKVDAEEPSSTAAPEPDDEVVQEEDHKQKVDESDDDDEDMNKAHIVYDFDLMLQKKKEESGRRRKFRNVDIINDSDDLIADLLTSMKTAADEDRELNKRRVAATKKLKMLPLVVSQLKKLDLKVAFLDQGVLSIMHEWLMPLPDRSLPHLQIRNSLLRLLAEFPPIDQGLLKTSGIGRAVMYLYKHPKESRENKEKAGKLISEWSRPIFNLNTNFSSMSKEEREHRDFEHMPKKRKLRLESGEDASDDINTALAGDDRALKPGEKGWVGRARVPLPSTRDYVVRPKSNVDLEFSRSGGRKSMTRLDKHIRSLKERKKQSKIQRAVSISIEGRKMSL